MVADPPQQPSQSASTRSRPVKPLICPVCHSPLAKAGQQVACKEGHHFDIAREGYVNLLLANQKASQQPGDSREMLMARRAFLDAGYYQPLSEVLNHTIIENLKASATVVDAGSGEGYYSGRLSAALVNQSANIFGVEIAKDGARYAAKRYPTVRYVVASIRRHLPFAEHTVDVILNVFSPRHPHEFDRILKADGFVLMVVPGSAHLVELRQKLDLPDKDESKRERAKNDLRPYFRLAYAHTLTYTVALDNQALVNLINMTPNQWLIDQEAGQKAAALQQFETRLTFDILTFHKTS